MKLNRKEFEILVLYANEQKKISQREITELLDYSLGTVNKIVKELTEKELLKNNIITDKGLETLEQYRVKRAVFVAAGFGSRLVPITLNTPKPLVKVNGVRIIDTLIDACIKADINEIYIVRGYLKEQFDQLLYKYPFIKFIDNNSYNEANNIGSALVAKEYIRNAYVLEADLFLSNPSLITKYQYSSSVLGIYKERTDDWCLEVNKDNYVTKEDIGGLNCYQMVGIYYINEEDGIKLSNHLENAFYSPGGRELYWENVMNQRYAGEYLIKVRPCKDEDIVEIDTFNELKKIDSSYDV